jgi:T5SS/PEP-CTERM-associated repeat protein
LKSLAPSAFVSHFAFNPSMIKRHETGFSSKIFETKSQPKTAGLCRRSGLHAGNFLFRDTRIAKILLEPMQLRLSCLFLVFLTVRLTAAESFWINPNGGEFWAPANWSAGVPTAADTAIFSQRSAYTVHFSDPATNSTALFHVGSVTQHVDNATWVLTDTLRVGEVINNTGRVTIASGALIVTNANTNAVIEAGCFGAGEFAIAGGRVIADSLLATNRSYSILQLRHGELTLLNGGSIDLGAKLYAGTTTSNVFTWNFFGGTTRVIDSPFSYGSVTLGSALPFTGNASRAILHLDGPTTVVEIPGLDVRESRRNFGGHQISISGGARLLTSRVQFGLNSSASNSVIISGPGSAWVNTETVWFGMHSGGQSLTITNGGAMDVVNFEFMHNADNRMVIGGSNATFLSRGLMNLGIVFCTPQCVFSNIANILPGGSLVANHIRLGSPLSGFGNPALGILLLVNGGTLQVQRLDFVTGAVEVEAGTATIQELNLADGKNAALRASDALLVGHEGTLSSGQLRIGQAHVAIPALNGNVNAPRVELGVTPGSTAYVAVTGGTVNASSALIVGRRGGATLDVTGGLVTSPQVSVGAEAGSAGSLTISGGSAEVRAHELRVAPDAQSYGMIWVTNWATLEVNVLEVDPSQPVTIAGGVLQFSTNAPFLSANSVFLGDGAISFRNVADAPVALGPASLLSPIVRYGPASLRLINSTNSQVGSLVVGPGENAYKNVTLANGVNRLQANWLQVDSGSQVLVTNSATVISGAVTNAGEIIVVDGTLVFEGPVHFKPGASISGTDGRVVFSNAVHLSSSDLVVAPGISVQFEGIASEGGRMILSSLELSSSNVPWPDGLVTMSNGIITYINTPDVPLSLPSGIDFVGDVGLRFINSSNAFVETHTFESGPTRYNRLYLTDDGDRWHSRTLAVGAGGALVITNGRPTVALDDRIFTIHSGGRFEDHTTNASVGFSTNASGHIAVVTDPGSVWTTGSDLRVGYFGGGNHLIISNGATVLSGEGYFGLNSGSTGNKVTVRGSNSLWSATNGVRLGFAGASSNILEVTDGASLVSAGPLSLSSGPSPSSGNTFVLSGDGSTATFGTPGAFTQGAFIRGTACRVVITTGAVLRSTSMLVGQFNLMSNLLAVIGPRARVVNSADLFMEGRETMLQVRDGGHFGTSNINAMPLSGGFEITGDGSLVEVQRSFRLANGGQFLLGAGATLIAPSLDLVGSPDLVRLVSSGQVLVTNTIQSGLLNVRAAVELLGGHLVADRVLATNGTNSRVFFHAGVVEARSSDFNMAQPLSIGSGSAFARWQATGGTNYFRQGMVVQPFAELTGAGVIVGNITNRGTISLRSSGAPLISTGALQFAQTASLGYLVEGLPQPSPALLIDQGPLHFDGMLRVTVASGYVPHPTNVYFVVHHPLSTGVFDNVADGRVLTTDNLGSFQVLYGLRLTDYRSEDADGDRIQDSWAVRHFGSSPLPPGTGIGARDGDDDGDGLSNIQEFQLGTDPHDSQSALRVEVIRHPSGGVALRFPYVAEWQYEISYSSDLQSWTTVADPALNVGAAETPEWVDSSPPSMRFYRVAVPN